MSRDPVDPLERIAELAERGVVVLESIAKYFAGAEARSIAHAEAQDQLARNLLDRLFPAAAPDAPPAPRAGALTEKEVDALLAEQAPEGATCPECGHSWALHADGDGGRPCIGSVECQCRLTAEQVIERANAEVSS